jgi:hypothetical protein
LITKIPSTDHLIPVFPTSISTYCVQLELALVHRKLGREELSLATLHELFSRLYNASVEFKEEYPTFVSWRNDYNVWLRFAAGYTSDHNLVFVAEVLGIAIEKVPSPEWKEDDTLKKELLSMLLRRVSALSLLGAEDMARHAAHLAFQVDPQDPIVLIRFSSFLDPTDEDDRSMIEEAKRVETIVLKVVRRARSFMLKRKMRRIGDMYI